MRIAVIGWGSLIWCPRELNLQSRWHRDGPDLPIEFARRSRDGRLTLVIHPPSPPVRTYWALSGCDDIEAATCDLAAREGSRLESVHGVSATEVYEDAIRTIVRDWIVSRRDLDAAIWTALPPHPEMSGADVVDKAIEYLSSLDSGALEQARRYIVRTPPQVQTAVRRAMQQRGWVDEVTPAELFE